MTIEGIIRMAKQAGFADEEIDTCQQILVHFAKLVADSIYAKQLELPEPRLTGKFSITMGKFKCTGCTGLWDSSEQAKNHSCRDYQ
jgi:hypothetical protein